MGKSPSGAQAPSLFAVFRHDRSRALIHSADAEMVSRRLESWRERAGSVVPLGLSPLCAFPSTEVLGCCSVAPAARAVLRHSALVAEGEYEPRLRGVRCGPDGGRGHLQGLKPPVFLPFSGTTEVMP